MFQTIQNRSMEEYCIAKDFEQNLYVVPANMLEEARRYFAALGKYHSYGWNRPDPNAVKPEPPCEILEITGDISTVCFKQFRIK